MTMLTFPIPANKARLANLTLARVTVLKDKSEIRKRKSRDDNMWLAYIAEAQQSKVTVAIEAPATAIVGKYRLAVSMVTKDAQDKDVKCVERYPGEFYLIFNPWCPGKSDTHHTKRRAKLTECHLLCC